MSGGHYTPAGFAKTSDGTPGQAQLDDSGNLKVNVVAGGVGGGVMTVNDGGDVAQGTTTDPAWTSGAGTVISLLKKLASGGGGSAVSIADGSDVATGTTSDTAWVSGSGTVISLLKKIASAGGSAVSVADGADVAQGTTSDTSSASTVIGLLKNIKAALAGALTLPTGASTSALQTTGNTSLSSLDTKTLPVSATITGTVTAVSDTLVLGVTGYGTVSGVLTTGPDLQSFFLHGTSDGTNWVSLPHETFGLSSAASSPITTGFINTDGASFTPVFHVNVSGMTAFRVQKAGGTAPSTWVLTATIPPYVPTSQQSRLYSHTGVGIRASSPGYLLIESGVPWNTRIQDVTNVNTAQVTAASTAATAADPALVVRSVQLPAALGQTTMAASEPVVLASDQSDLKIANGVVPQVSGTLLEDTLNSAVTITGLAGYGSVIGRLVGSGGAGSPVGIAREATIDGSTWFAVGAFLIQGSQNGAIVFGARSGASSLYTSNDAWYELIPVGYGITGVRYRVSSTIAAGSTAGVRFAASAATMPFATSVSFPSSQAVTAAQGSAGTNAAAWWTRIGDATNGPAAVKPASTAVATTDAALVVGLSANSQTINVNANQSAANASLGNAWGTKLTDTVNGPVAVKAASTAAAATDPALVVRSIQLPTALGQTTMSASLPVALASDQSALAVSAASLPLPTGAATEASLTNGNQKSKLTDGAGIGGGEAAVGTRTLLSALEPPDGYPGLRTYSELVHSLPAGTNVIGHVVVDAAPASVSATTADVYANDGSGPNYTTSEVLQHLTQTYDGRLRVILETQSQQAFLQLNLLNQMLATLKAMNLQLVNMTGVGVDPGEFLNDSIN